MDGFATYFRSTSCPDSLSTSSQRFERLIRRDSVLLARSAIACHPIQARVEIVTRRKLLQGSALERSPRVYHLVFHRHSTGLLDITSIIGGTTGQRETGPHQIDTARHHDIRTTLACF